MLISITRPPVPLVDVDDPAIEALVNLMPDYSAGRRLHALYVNHLQEALPGNYSQLFGTGPAFRTVFFPSWTADPLRGLIADTGLDGGWWSGFSVAVLCQAIAEMGSSIRGQMVVAGIDAAVASHNTTLRTRSAVVYAKVLAGTYPPLVELLARVDPATAKQQFHDALLSNVINRQLWYQAGMWTSPEWEMFNQYAKYLALGATDAEVDTLIGELVAAGLPVPSEVGAGAWRTYAEELRDKPDVDVADIRATTSGPITESTLLPSYGGYPSWMPNGNCYEFTANSQPGTTYRQLPGGCCFRGDTQVLDRSGVPVALRDLQRGDELLTRDGVATVAYVARPLRAGRSLHAMVGGGPVFTATHPIVNAAGVDPDDRPPAMLALDPARLAWAVPTLGEDGIGPLEVGSTVWSRAAGRDASPERVDVTGLRAVPPHPGDETLFDVRFEPGRGARHEFWAGQDSTFLLVAPEYPILDQAGPAAIAVVAIMEGLLGSGGPNGSGWPRWIVDTLDDVGVGIFVGTLQQALAATPSFGAPEPEVGLHERIDRLYGELAAAGDEAAAVAASLFDGLLGSLGQWLAALVAMGWRDSLVLGGDVLAITVFDLELTPANPLPRGGPIELDLAVTGNATTEDVRLWARGGRGATRFHHDVDQLVHVDLSGEQRPTELSFTVRRAGTDLASLVATAPGTTVDAAHRLQSAVLTDAAGRTVGSIRFDLRRLGRDAASGELGRSGRWTQDAAEAYANALGEAMVRPILWQLAQRAPAGRR